MAFKLARAKTADTLAGIGIFRDLPSEVMTTLSQRCQWRRYCARQTILVRGDDSREVFFVVRGKVRATLFSECGREVCFRDLRAGEMFGELAAIDGLPRSSDVVAVTDTVVAVMSASLFWDLLRAHESVDASVLRGLAYQVRVLSERVVEFSTLAVQNRIQAELLRLARECSPGRNCAVIFPAPTHAEFASRVSTHREAVTRCLGALARKGIVEKRRGTLVIRDLEALAAWSTECSSSSANLDRVCMPV